MKHNLLISFLFFAFKFGEIKWIETETNVRSHGIQFISFHGIPLRFFWNSTNLEEYCRGNIKWVFLGVCNEKFLPCVVKLFLLLYFIQLDTRIDILLHKYNVFYQPWMKFQESFGYVLTRYSFQQLGDGRKVWSKKTIFSD